MKFDHQSKLSSVGRFVFVMGIMIMISVLMIACSEDDGPAPAPTVAVIFNTITPFPTVTPFPTLPPPPTPTPPPTPIIETITIYDDGFAPGWSAENSEFVFFELDSTEFVYDGSTSIKVVPRVESAAAFYITLDQSSGQIYRRDEIISLSFYLNPGLELMEPTDLVITMQGSEEFPFWVAGDNSAANANNGVSFSETLLAFFEINRSIPPDTWILIENFLDDREFDPTPEFITGFYIKNGGSFLQPFYIDRIEMTRVVQPEG